jgi:hypothetical protein
MPTPTKVEPGKPLGDKAPALETFQNQPCPNCGTGVLYVLRYDPNALHEVGQGKALAANHGSGGAVEQKCLYCDFGQTIPLNPGSEHGTAVDDGES